MRSISPKQINGYNLFDIYLSKLLNGLSSGANIYTHVVIKIWMDDDTYISMCLIILYAPLLTLHHTEKSAFVSGILYSRFACEQLCMAYL